jgi:hypothetical protein
MMIMLRNSLVTLTFFMLIKSSFALEVGEKYSLGGNIEHTITSIINKSKSSVEFLEEITEADAKEYCEIPAFSLAYPNIRTCIRKNIMKARKISVECNPATITVDGNSYRPRKGEIPWRSITQKNHIIQGGDLFQLACGNS